MNPYAELGVDRKADPETIKRAYRKRAQSAHPDRAGGNAEKFHAIQKSYEILSDAKRREHFDKHGEDGKQQDPREVALGTIAGILFQVIDKADIEHTDIPKVIGDHVRQQIGALKTKIRENEKRIERREKALKRFEKKGAGPNMFALMIENDIRQTRATIEGIERELETGAEIMKILAEYRYQMDIWTPQSARPAGAEAFMQYFGTRR